VGIMTTGLLVREGEVGIIAIGVVRVVCELHKNDRLADVRLISPAQHRSPVSARRREINA
jgi:hypothetical protein